ncbi:MAG: HD domain-containing protein [Candidatus Lindowbacteria bacterium]|nr:HD domain-containing protein [Candidatus Lindowbacteria bacterium]
MRKRRELRDPIHGFIERRETEERIIDTPVFQRLRGIKQLAMAYLAYPGATHTRFDHSIGVMHIAGRLAMQLIDDQEERRMVRLAALLHDLGHGPFSHISEDVLDRYYDKAKVRPEAKEKIHEHLTCNLIERDKEIVKLLSEYEREKIVGLLLGTSGRSICHGIISGPLDADKQDYLLRDSYFCGVKYGVFDLERLIGTLEVYHHFDDEILAAARDGVYAIEQFVLAKYHMTAQVYCHKIRLVSDAMIVRALELGIEVDKIEWLRRLYAYDGSDQYIQNYLQWDDQRLTTQLLFPGNSGGHATELFWRLRNRNLFKRVFAVPLREFEDPGSREILSNINKENELGFRKKVESLISEFLSSGTGQEVPALYTIVRAFTIKSVREKTPNPEGSITILTDGTPKRFEDESSLFESIESRESEEHLEVYAPVTFRDDMEKRKKREEFGKGIRDILNKAARGEKRKEKGKGGQDDS